MSFSVDWGAVVGCDNFLFKLRLNDSSVAKEYFVDHVWVVLVSVLVVAVPSVAIVESGWVVTVERQLVTKRTRNTVGLNADSVLQLFELLITEQRYL